MSLLPHLPRAGGDNSQREGVENIFTRRTGVFLCDFLLLIKICPHGKFPKSAPELSSFLISFYFPLCD